MKSSKKTSSGRAPTKGRKPKSKPRIRGSNQAVVASSLLRTIAVYRNIRTILPPRMATVLTYYDYYNLATGGAASYSITSFRMNSCRDPQVSVGGGSPSGFTQLGYLYLRYVIDRVDVSVWGYSTVASAQNIGIWFRSTSGSAFGNAVEAQQSLMEFPNLSTVCTLIPYGANTNYPEFDLRASKSLNDLEGRPCFDNDYSTTFGSEPNLQTYVDVVQVASDGAAVSLTANAHIRIRYHVVAYQLNQTYTD